MAHIKILIFLFITLIPFKGKAQSSKFFDRGSQEFGLSNLGIGYSSQAGLMVQATTRYQYYVWRRVALGGTAFYDKFLSQEWMGIGPVGSYIFATYINQWFARFDQQLTFAKFNGASGDPSNTYGTSSISVNYFPTLSNYSIGLGYAHSYALDRGEVIRPNSIQLFVGWFWQ